MQENNTLSAGVAFEQTEVRECGTVDGGDAQNNAMVLWGEGRPGVED